MTSDMINYSKRMLLDFYGLDVSDMSRMEIQNIINLLLIVQASVNTDPDTRQKH